MIEVVSGYLDPRYARSLSGFGTPVELPAAGGWILRRPIADSERQDAMGCYPLFACRRWERLAEELARLQGSDLVSLALVTDPFCPLGAEALGGIFDRVLEFKQHFLYDLEVAPEAHLSGNRPRFARQALRKLQIEVAADPGQHLDEWTALYDVLVARHGITGIKAFSRAAFAEQLQITGAELFLARERRQGKLVAAQLWFSDGEVAYHHLAAGDEAAYKLNAAYGLYWFAIEHFRARAAAGADVAGGLRWLDFGAGAGLSGGAEDGLTRFKQGWSTHTRPVHFCGKILDQAAYARLTEARGQTTSRYFPAYRHGEFG